MIIMETGKILHSVGFGGSGLEVQTFGFVFFRGFGFGG